MSRKTATPPKKKPQPVSKSQAKRLAIMAGEPSDDLENKLMGDDNGDRDFPDVNYDDDQKYSSLLSLNPERDVEAVLDLSEYKKETRSSKGKFLEGVEAMRFLGIQDAENRPHNALMRGDYSDIHLKFKPLFERWKLLEERNNVEINKDKEFWAQIKIRVWHKSNIEALTRKEIIGKETAPCPSLGIEGGRYTGEVLDGRSFSTVLNEKQNTQARQFFVRLIGVNVTEEMKRYA